jgi:hypothetical protein
MSPSLTDLVMIPFGDAIPLPKLKFSPATKSTSVLVASDAGMILVMGIVERLRDMIHIGFT